MTNTIPFCTCGDTSCPNHPSNHDQGCTLCIAKNLRLGEIPSCFFSKADPDYHGPGYLMEDFASLMQRKNEK